jgi:hypothetical protein
MFLYARIYWLAEFGDVSCLQFNYLRVETLTPTWEDFVESDIWSQASYTDPSKCINDQTLRSDTEFCRTSLLKLFDKCPTKLSDKILPGRSESLHSQIVRANAPDIVNRQLSAASERALASIVAST